MELLETANSPVAKGGLRIAFAGAAAALLFYSLLLLHNEGAVAGGSDSSGYMNQAKLISAGQVSVHARTLPGLTCASAPYYLYVPLGFRPALEAEKLVPTYPAGFSLFIAAMSPVLGWTHAGFLAILLNSLGGVLATYGLCRALGLERCWALLGALVIAASPLYLFMSLQTMSDVPSLCWTSLAVLAALHSRRRPSWALIAGAATAIDVLLRPTNILVLAPVAIALGAAPRRWICLFAGGLPGAVFLAVHNQASYGHLATTGYGDVSVYFSSSYVPGTLVHYARWLPVLFTPVVILAPALPWAAGAARRDTWLLSVWVVAFAGLYSMYFCSHESWGYLRFLLPMAPALVAAGLLVLRGFLSRRAARFDPARSALAMAAFAAGVGLFSGWWTHSLRALNIGEGERRYVAVADWLGSHVPRDAVCLCMQTSGALFYYTDLTVVRWDMIEPGSVGTVGDAIRASGKPLFAVLFDFELRDGALSRRFPGDWERVVQIGDASVWRCNLGRPAAVR